MRVGFVGVGRLGGQLAASLLRHGFDLVAYDRDRDALATIGALGAEVAPSPGAVAALVDVVVTCLPSPTISSDVVSGAEGVFSRLRDGGVWIEMSTTDKHEVVRLAELGRQRGIATLEAPVTGGVHLAATGELTVILGGEATLVETYLPLFRAVGKRIFHVGPLGRASDLKVITNMLAFIHLVACGEALMLAKRSELDLRQAWEVISASSGTSFVHETEGQVILNGSYDIGFTMDLALKDLDLALGLAEETGVPLALGALTQTIFETASERFGCSAFSPMVVRLLEEKVGVELRAPGFPATLEPAG